MTLPAPAIDDARPARKPRAATPSTLAEAVRQLERLQATRTEWRAKLADLDTEIAAKQKDIKTKVDEIGKR
jgi:hypothetical protein